MDEIARLCAFFDVQLLQNWSQGNLEGVRKKNLVKLRWCFLWALLLLYICLTAEGNQHNKFFIFLILQ